MVRMQSRPAKGRRLDKQIDNVLLLSTTIREQSYFQIVPMKGLRRAAQDTSSCHPIYRKKKVNWLTESKEFLLSSSRTNGALAIHALSREWVEFCIGFVYSP
jgi:hypothetical protein